MPITFQSVLYSAAGDLESCIRAPTLPPVIDELDDWKKSSDLAPKELKFLDRQMVLLYRVVADLLAGQTDFDKNRGGVQVAVGPGRTDLDALLHWGKRIREDETLPTIQPALAVSLLHNTPLSWLSLKFGLKGDCGVWSGFSEAGFAALEGALLALSAGVPEVLVAAANCPRNYFVETTLRRGDFENRFPATEIGIAQRFRTHGPGAKLHELRVYPPGSDAQTICREQAERHHQAFPDLWSHAVLEGTNDRHDLSTKVGNTMPCAMPLALGLAGAGFWGKSMIPVFLTTPSSHLLFGLVEPQ